MNRILYCILPQRIQHVGCSFIPPLHSQGGELCLPCTLVLTAALIHTAFSFCRVLCCSCCVFVCATCFSSYSSHSHLHSKLCSFTPPFHSQAWEVARTVVAPPSSVVKCLWEVLVWEFGVLFLSCVVVSVSGVLFSVEVCVCVTC